MTRLGARWRQLRRSGSRGLGLVETLVAISLTLLLTGMLFGTVTATAKVVGHNKQQVDLTEEARLLLDRMSRELRQATAITAVTNPTGPGYVATADTAITFEADFNGDGVIEPDATDPEVLTYQFDAANHRVLLLAAGQTVPILAGNVSAFALSFSGGGQDWSAIDANSAAGGNGNGVLDVELGKIDTVGIAITMSSGTSSQSFQTTIDLRNLTR